MLNAERIDLTQPRWNQSTFYGRLCHYANITDMRTVPTPEATLLKARNLVQLYSRGEEPTGTTVVELYRAQKLYQSAFHPDTGQLQNVFGRMSFNAVGGTVLCAAMMIWYRSTAAVIFWQWTNQSFNALVNYTNRNAKSSISSTQIATAYVSATGSALVTAIGLKSFLAQRAGNLAQRLVPLVAVAAANCVNVPLMRQSELKDGIGLTDEKDNQLCISRLAAAKAVSLVTFSRVIIATPCMLFTPIIMEKIDRMRWFARNRGLLNVPVQVALTFALLVGMVPVGCALFPQRNWVSVDTLKRWEPQSVEQLTQNIRGQQVPKYLYFNKGL